MAARAEKHEIGCVVGKRRSLCFVMVRPTPGALWTRWQDVGDLSPVHGLTCPVVVHEVGATQLTVACSLSPYDTFRHVVGVEAPSGSLRFSHSVRPAVLPYVHLLALPCSYQRTLHMSRLRFIFSLWPVTIDYFHLSTISICGYS